MSLATRLEAAQTRVADRVLIDRCTLWRDPEGTRDDTYDPDTLSYGSTGDAEPVETDLACKVGRPTLRPVYGELGQPTVISEYPVSLPADTDVLAGDRLEMTRSNLDPSLVGQQLLILEPSHSSTSVLTKVRAQLRQQGVEAP